MESKDFIHEHPLIFLEDLKVNGEKEVVSEDLKVDGEKEVVSEDLKVDGEDSEDSEDSEDLKEVDGEKEVVCGVCEEPPSGPGYKCSDCNFLCHKSCFQLPEEILQHPLHPNHTLCIERPGYAWGWRRDDCYCVACGKRSRRCFFYECMDCNFTLDTKCASRWRVSKDECHQHAYVPLLKQIQFTCEACGEEGKDIGDDDEGIGLLCSICLLVIHPRCALLSRTIRIYWHDHPLTLTYSIHQEKEGANILCRLCRKEVNTKHATYYCHTCSYATHLSCAEKVQKTDEWMGRKGISNELPPIGSIVNVTGLFKDINRVENERGILQEIEHHFSHQHDLILDFDEVKDDKICDGCMQLISPPFYSCVRCNFSLHNICAKLPTNARHSFLPVSFTLLSQTPFPDGVFNCALCGRYRHGFAYKYEKSNHFVDSQCFAIQEALHHEGHQHPLFVTERTFLEEECKFCGRNSWFVCYPCNFNLCFRCATLPLLASHKYDEHPLKLTYTAEDIFGEYYCLICEEKRDQDYWFYYCEKCDFSAHPQCALGKYPYIKFGKTYKDEHHKHPFTFVRKTKYSPPCDVCNDHFDEIALECTQCELTVHPGFGFPEDEDKEYTCLQRLVIDEDEEAERDENGVK
jgi:hypothetical protein